jgi:hypothetical protein
MQVEVVYQMVFGELNNLSPCPLPLQGKGEKEKRGGEAPSLKDSSPSPLKESHAKLYEEDTIEEPLLEHYYFEEDENFLSFEVHFPIRAQEWKQLKNEAVVLKGYFNIVSRGTSSNNKVEYEDAKSRINL